MTPPLTPLAQIGKASEQTAEAIRAAARMIDETAGAQLPAALRELAAACGRAKQRVEDARRQAAEVVADLLAAFDSLTAETLEGVEHATPTPPPPEAPVEAPAAEAPAGPKRRPARKAALPAPLVELLPGGPAPGRHGEGSGKATGRASGAGKGAGRKATSRAGGAGK